MSDTDPMSQDQALRYLAEILRYTWPEAVNAVNGAPAAEDRTYQLARHQVRWDYPGVYFITETPDPRLHDSAGRRLPVSSPGMTREQAAEELRRLGWAEDLLLIMTNLAARDGAFWLDEHTALSCTNGSYQIRERRQAGCCHEPEGREIALAPGYEPGPGEYESRYPHLASGHKLSRDQIAKHGRDRYPTPGAQYAKLLDEAGELGEALIEWAGTEAPECLARVRAEYADAGLALYALGDKLGLDLIACMAGLVAGDTRSFAVAPICGTCGTRCDGKGACPGPVTVWKGSREDETGERP